jgi:molybdopterin/thiamine biosynthesis adenylyltransferase
LCTLQGGPKKINLADPDTIGLSNLNRILAGVDDLGRKKTEVLAEKLYETDPFLEITQFDEGANNIPEFIRSRNKLVDVIAEEVDHLPTKIALREAASANKIPLFSITDNGDGIIADVERYDQGFDINDFYKRLKKMPEDKKNLKVQDILKMVSNFIGLKDIDTRMLESSMKMGTEIYSWPQLGGAAVLSGVVGAYIIRQIVNKKELKSGRYVISLPDVFSLHDKNDKKLRKKLLKYYKY